MSNPPSALTLRISLLCLPGLEFKCQLFKKTSRGPPQSLVSESRRSHRTGAALPYLPRARLVCWAPYFRRHNAGVRRSTRSRASPSPPATLSVILRPLSLNFLTCKTGIPVRPASCCLRKIKLGDVVSKSFACSLASFPTVVIDCLDIRQGLLSWSNQHYWLLQFVFN